MEKLMAQIFKVDDVSDNGNTDFDGNTLDDVTRDNHLDQLPSAEGC